jgi:hypothetical protein
MANPSAVSGSNKNLAGVIGFFDDPHGLIHATTQVRDANYENFDAFTPFPVHGLDDAQGLKRSPLPFVTLAAGMTGCTLAFLLEYWTSAVDWPLIIGGKPYNSWPAFVPIMFELTVLFAGLSTVAAMFLLNGLPNIKRKSFDPGITRDRFALVIEAPVVKVAGEHAGEHDDADEMAERSAKKKTQYKVFNESEATDFLKKLGAKEVKSVYTQGWF